MPSGPSSVIATRAPMLWDASLERFGATQLNDRYRRRFGVGMDGPAWAGWFAAKLAKTGPPGSLTC